MKETLFLRTEASLTPSRTLAKFSVLPHLRNTLKQLPSPRAMPYYTAIVLPH
jgi:hypothetical protein